MEGAVKSGEFKLSLSNNYLTIFISVFHPRLHFDVSNFASFDIKDEAVGALP